MFELILACSIVIFVSATCSLFEAALYSLPASQIESLVHEGRKSGKILKRLREKIDQPITAILSLNTISNTAGAAAAGAIAVNLMGEASFVYFSAVFTAAILFFAEVLPKTAGVVFSRFLARFIAGPILFMVWVFMPVIWLIGLGTRLISGNSPPGEILPEELIVMARMGLKSGSIREDEAAVIQNILAVRTKTVNDVMTPRSVLYYVSGELSVEEVSQDKRIYAHSRVPVYVGDSEDVAGILYRRDVLSALAEQRGHLKLREMMKPVHFVLETTTLDKVLKLFLERGQHMFVVIDEFGSLAGVITLEDVLEEILGKEIIDEFDEVPDMRQLAIRRREELLKAGAKPPLREQP